MTAIMSRVNNFNLYTSLLDDSTAINEALLSGLEQHIDDENTRKTHHFYGRYENIYINSEQIPAIDQVISACLETAAKILDTPEKELKAGLWFNVMNPGDRTTLHRHDDDNELLSAVYYVKVADDSGTLRIGKDAVMSEVTPAEGMFVFFAPNMPHEVTENLSTESRISLGINIGPIHTDDE